MKRNNMKRERPDISGDPNEFDKLSCVKNITRHELTETGKLFINPNSVYYMDKPGDRSCAKLNMAHILGDVFIVLSRLSERVDKLEKAQSTITETTNGEVYELQEHLKFLEDNLRCIRATITETD